MTEKRCLLVLPAGNASRQTGGGQRTALLFEALKRIGPTDLVLLGSTPGGEPFVPDPATQAVSFPGSGHVWLVSTNRYPTRALRGMEWLWFNLRRFARVDRMYASDALAASTLRTFLKGGDYGVVAFRYSQPYCIMDVTASPALKVFVDVDDRDDQKYATAAKAIMGNGLPGRLFQRLILPRVQRILVERLSKVSLLWYASEEDFLPIPAVRTRLLRNVPFTEAPPGMTGPADKRDVLFVGTFPHRPNQNGVRWFLRHCWPEIRRQNPDSRFRIVGKGDWPSLAAEFPDLTGVDYVGTVDDLLPEYERARITVSPVLEGGGSKIKVIESCAFRRLPVVSVHSARGFGEQIEAALPKAADAADFIRLCNLYLSDDAAMTELTERLHLLQQAEFSRSSAERQIEEDVRAELPR